jgi:putative transposase
MARIPRIVVPGIPHHITQRGNGHKQVFFTDFDHLLYLRLLHKYAQRYQLSLWGYCLMPNHVHLIAVPLNPNSLSRTLAMTHMDFARLANIRADTSGHFWQSRFYSCPMDAPHTWAALAYTERNPVRAGLTRHAADYPWSSAAAHLGGDDPLIDLAPWQQLHNPETWRPALTALSPDKALEQRIRQSNHTGRPLGDESFIRQLEKTNGRYLAPRPRGRQPITPTSHQTPYRP